MAEQYRPECPHDSTLTYYKSGDHAVGTTTMNTNEVTLSNLRTDIPEFHDCQRLLKQDSTYGPLVAIYASSRLDSAMADLYRLNPMEERRGKQGRRIVTTPRAPRSAQRSAWALAIGTILSFDGDYPQLNIKRGFSCVYLAGSLQNGLAAWIVFNGNNPRCAPRLSISEVTANGFLLEVLPYTVAGMTDEDYPPAARWDWDSVNAKQYIGFKCGAAWCEVGIPDFTPSRRWTAPSSMTSRLERRVFEIKGWYDEQLLAIKDPGTTAPRPSSILGTVFPDPGLDTLASGTFSTERPAVFVMISKDSANYYKNKFNYLAYTPPTNRVVLAKLNRLWIRNTTATGWNNKIFSHLGTNDRVRREIFRDHSADIATGNFVIPGNARWRWVLSDETVWKGCDAGCCESQPL
ncbi:MAG: hypothetical protein ACT4O1_16560 [Gemmatimonadota bacterium]